MVQVSERVGSLQKGSMKAVAGSGMASMSEASMDFQPRMEEPSKPKPSSKTSSVSSPMGTLKCCQVPKVSTNFTSTIFAPCFRAFSITLFGVAVLGGLAVLMNGFAVIGSVLSVHKKSPTHPPGRGSILQTSSNGVLALLLRADAHGILDRADEHLAVPNLAGPGGLHDRLDRLVHEIIHEDDFDFYLGKKIHGVLAAAINLGVTLLPSEALHLA